MAAAGVTFIPRLVLGFAVVVPFGDGRCLLASAVIVVVVAVPRRRRLHHRVQPLIELLFRLAREVEHRSCCQQPKRTNQIRSSSQFTPMKRNEFQT